MKKLFRSMLLISWIGLIPFSIHAQTFSFEMDQTFLSGTPQPNGQLKFTGTITNLTNQAINVNLNRAEDVLPAGWSSSICVGITCNDPSVSSVRISLEANESVHLELDVNVHESVPGAAEIHLSVTYGNESITHRLVASTDPNVISDNLPIKQAFRLNPNYPNPFNPVTNIPYEINKASIGRIRLAVYNITGQLVKVLYDGYKPSGHYVAKWNGTNQLGQMVASGVYFARMETSTISSTRSMILMK